MRAKSLFFANASHELRTPLNAVIGFAQLLQDSHATLNEDKRQAFVGHILRAGRHLLDVINDVLELSKAEAGKVEFSPTDFDVGDIVRELVETMRPLAERKGHQLVFDLDPDVTAVRLDVARLRQVLYNYLSNAIKFTPSFGTIVARTRARGRHAFMLEVQDNGIGLSADEQAELFEEFRQLGRKPGQDGAGSGLGLALTRRLAIAQGGSAGVCSEVGQGSRFFVVLPREHRPPGDASGRVMVVDDDGVFTRDLMGRIEQAGYEVRRMSDVDEASKVVEAERVDAIVLGLEVGGRSGLELLARRSDHVLAAVNGLNVRVERDLGAIFPIADVLVKPSSAMDVERALALCAQGPRRPAVLVVDDDGIARALMAEQLQSLGVDVRLACSGAQALAMLDEAQPDLIVLDLLMEGMNGFEVLTSIRARADMAHLPVCIWTALTLSAEQQEGLRRSAARVLLKGRANIDELLNELFPVMGRHVQ
ncbi:response regulator [Roseateles chitinivorans]|uniref:ATP-binding response regulator n=1 Tax=Roseateles chitinivorans TaxID=2917965 RepID=UPI003D66908A